MTTCMYSYWGSAWRQLEPSWKEKQNLLSADILHSTYGPYVGHTSLPMISTRPHQCFPAAANANKPR
eukprot:15366768-Ditylum_brightwellii.AAC.2